MIQRLIRPAAAAAAVLVTVACGITDADAGDPCFRGDKTDAPDDDVRIGIFNDTGTPGLRATFAGPNNQRQTCTEVRTSPAEPTNVVFRMSVGESMTVRIEGGDPPVNSVVASCTLTSDAFATPDFGTPGNAGISISMGPVSAGTPSTAFCGQGFESAFFSSGGGADRPSASAAAGR